MIEQGDGEMARRIADGLCPACKTALVFLRDDGHKAEAHCKTCGLKIVEAKGSKRDEES